MARKMESVRASGLYEPVGRTPESCPDRAVVRRRRAVGVALVCMLGGAVSAADIAGTPLVPRSVAAGPTMFTELNPARTGIMTANAYDDPDMWGDHFQEFKFGAIGTGVTVGDYDNDGRPDLFVVSKTGPCRLFRNLGGWKFADVTASAGLDTSASWTDTVKSWVGMSDARADTVSAWKQGATFADVDNDGWLDLHVCRFGAPNWLFMNQRDGTFREEAAARGLALIDGSGMGAFCDYDRDGWLDVYVQTNLLDNATHPRGQRDHLFHNNGDGTFTDVSDAAGITGETQGHSATWWDYDNDGWPDLYVANDFAPPDRLYRNNRDGTFTDQLDAVVPHTPHSAMGADLGDVDNDGLVDFLVADMAATTHEKDQRGMAKIRGMLTDTPTGPAAEYMRNALFLNTGTGRMLECAHLAGLQATDWTWSVRFEDLDNDGRLDVFFTNGMVRELHNADIIWRLSAAESLAEKMRLERAGPPLEEANLAFRNLGDLRFEKVGAAWGLDRRGVSFGAAFGDFDGDGDLDLVFANYQQPLTVMRNDSPSGHRIVVALRGTVSNRYGVGAVVRVETDDGVQVRPLVLARGYLSSSEPVLHFGLGESKRVQRLTVAWPCGRSQEFHDLAVDQRYTITEPPGAVSLDRPGESAAATSQFADVATTANLGLLARSGPARGDSRQPLLPLRFNGRGPALAVADLDGDGRPDLVLGGTIKAPPRVILAKDGAPYAPPRVLEPKAPGNVNSDDGPLLAFDADGDGNNDVLYARAAPGPDAELTDDNLRLLFNDGQGRFHAAPPQAVPDGRLRAGALAAADYDRDGRIDVFVGARMEPGLYPMTPHSALWSNRGGRFENVTDAIAPALRDVGMVTSALWSDVDNDGWPDLLVALDWGGIRYIHNDGGTAFSDRSDAAGFSHAGTGWWTSLAAADFNGDGRMDYVAGNAGLNTPYHASPEHPALLFYGPFRPGGARRIIEAGYEGDRLYPWRTLWDLGAQIPSIQRRFPKDDDYARATLEEVVGADRLAAAQRFAATELRSGVFLSRDDGGYGFEPLPRRAQIAPLQGIVTGDFDGDGHADIYAVQNSYAPIPPVGRFDGGLSQLLSGDGHGHFTPVPPARSGLVVPGDAEALVVLDLGADGWPDFVVSRHDDTSLAFRNHEAPGRHALRVELRGPPGNPTAIGARVTLELADGATQVAEIAAGSGLLSQSSAACFFGYTDNNAPRRLRVRWPTGATSEQRIASAPPSLTISAPP